MNEEKVPVVFISYCWTSETHKQWVRNLATRLVEKSGVNVILDIWNLKAGNDMYAFMEEIEKSDKVLVICDKMYCEKADNRGGGVGTETLIITPYVYQNTNQDKFIPIALAKDSKGKFLLPTYLKSRLALDMTNPDNFENDYKELERLIWEEPQFKPPVRGPKPNFKDQEVTVTVDSRKKRPIIESNTNEERVVWLLPRGFLLFDNITFIPSESWITRAHYYNYDGECQLGIHFHPSHKKTWDENLDSNLNRLRIPKADWNWCYTPLSFLKKFRMVNVPIDIKDMISGYPAYYFAPGVKIPLPEVPEEYRFYYETGGLRDIIEEIKKWTSASLQTAELLHRQAVSIRHSTYLNSLKLLGKDNPSLSFIKEVIDQYDPTFDLIDIKQWFIKLEEILSSTLVHEEKEWREEFKRSSR